MSETKNYTLTVREVLRNLQALADAYEKVASGTSPTGNYYFSCNAADAAASIKAAQQLILQHLIGQSPEWVLVSERLPEDGLWCWVDVGMGREPFPALRDIRAAGGWTNADTWEDFEKSVIRWALLPEPRDCALHNRERGET